MKRWMPLLLLAQMALTIAVVTAGCDRRHLGERTTQAYRAIFSLQAQEQGKDAKAPAPMGGDEARVIWKVYLDSFSREAASGGTETPTVLVASPAATSGNESE